MKRSIAASERQFAEAPSSHSRADVTLAPTLSDHPHYVWEGYPKQRTASIFHPSTLRPCLPFGPRT